MERNSNILQELPDWLLRYLLGQVDSEEEKKLRAVERMYGLSHFTKEEIIERLKTPEQFNTAEAFLTFNKKCLKSQRRLRVRYWSVAASIVLLIGLSYFGYQQIPFHSEQKTYISPGKLQATITLANGQMVDLHSGQQQLEEQDGTSIVQDSGCLVYSSVLSGKKTLYNTVSVPKGGEYRLCLSDGTKVWLNADSKIKYPVSFGQDKREVSLRGEGYFEVAKDSARPFIMSTDKMDVKVLGTTFDVNTYEDDGKSFVVLVEGLVEVSAGKGESRIITPGYMAEVDMHDVQAKIHVSKCDTEHYIAWKSGNFSFRNASLTEILKRVSRYYDVTVIREQVFEEEYYTGDVSSDVSLESLLAVIESSTSVSFKVERKIVYVQKKRD